MTTERIDTDAFFELITSFKHEAWRWECQGEYHEPSEREPFQAWREGRPDYSFLDDWLATIRRLRAEGRTFSRVRMVTDPTTDYLRFEAAFTHLNIEAGEDIRWMSEANARMFGAPTVDYYLLDDERVVIIEFDDNGVAGARVTDDALELEWARRWRRLALGNSKPHHEYMSRST